MFAGYEWVVLDAYDANNKDHVRIKEGIEVGNGLPTIVAGAEINANLVSSGFEVIASYDANRGVHAANEIPWYQVGVRKKYVFLTLVPGPNLDF
jgi:sterol 24-C-methyltransferase